MDYENQNNAYKTFLMNEAYEQEIMDLYIEEAITWASGEMTEEKLLYFQESVKDKAKEKFKGAWEAIKKAIRTVTGRIANFFKSQKSFLEDNKDIIISKKLKYKEDFDLYPYTEGLRRIAVKTAAFDYSKVSALNPEGDYGKLVVKGYFELPFECTKDDLADKCDDYFRGGDEKTYQANEINMTDLYNTCYDYEEKIEKPLKNDLAVIEDAQNKMINAMDKVKVTSESFLFSDEPQIIYSQFLESYIIFNEEDQDANAPEKETDNLQTRSNNPAVHKSGDLVKNNKMNKSDNNYGKDGQIEKDINGDKEKWNKLNEQCELYISTAKIITNSKLKIAEEIKNKYWEIIENHVKDYIGQSKDDKEGDKPRDTGTDYANITDPEVKKALNNQKGIEKVTLAYKTGNEKNDKKNDYYIKIEYINNEGKNDIKVQDVNAIYPNNDNNIRFIPGSARVVRDKKTNVYRLFRSYWDMSSGKSVKKTLAAFINLNKANVASDQFPDSNTNTKNVN